MNTGRQTSKLLYYPTVLAVVFFQAPLAYLGTATYHKVLPLLLAAAVAAAYILIGRLEQTRPHLAHGIGLLYFGGVIAGQVLPLYFLFITGPLYFPVPLLLGLAGFFFLRRRLTGALVIALAALMVFVQAVTLPGPALLLLVIAVAALIALALGDAFSRLNRFSVALALAGLLVAVRLIVFLEGVPPGAEARVSGQPAATILVRPQDLEDRERIWSKPPQVRFASESCDGNYYYVGTRGERPGLFEIDRKTGNRRYLEISGGASDNMVQDCRTGLIYLGDYAGHRFYRIDDKTLKVTGEIKVPDGLPAIFRLSPDGKLLYALPDEANHLFLINTQDFSVIGQAPDRQANTALILDLARSRIVRLTNAGRVVLLDRFSLKKLREKRVSGQLYFNAALDENRNELVVNNMASGRLFALDRDSLATVRKGRHERGLRFIVWDRSRDLYYVGNFFTGDLVALEPEGFAEKARLFTGPRPRWVEFAEDGRSLLVASGVGLVRIDLQSWVGPPTIDQPSNSD